jgi:hypothetical protein
LCTRNETPTPALRFGAVYISTLGAPPSTHVAHATVKKSPPTFVQAGPMDPWALMQKALLDALVLQESALFQAEHAHAAQDQCPPGA